MKTHNPDNTNTITHDNSETGDLAAEQDAARHVLNRCFRCQEEEAVYWGRITSDELSGFTDYAEEILDAARVLGQESEIGVGVCQECVDEIAPCPHCRWLFFLSNGYGAYGSEECGEADNWSFSGYSGF